MRKRVLIINYAGLKYGGIEKFISDLMSYSIEENYRVIWLTTQECLENADYKVAQNNALEKVVVCKNKRRLHQFKKIELNIKTEEHVTMISFDPISYISVDYLRNRSKKGMFDHFYIIPHFTGNIYFLNRYFKNKYIAKIVNKYMANIVNKMMANNSLLAFGEKHFKEYEKAYQVKLKDYKNLIVKNIQIEKELSDIELLEKAKRRKKYFEIVTCARFDFPHKGYIVGMINDFKYIKQFIPYATLTIAGYGDGIEKINKTIQALPEDCQKSINLPGALNTDELEAMYRRATLNIGVAGALSTGARCGVVSFPVRHYSYNCETYGYYEKVSNMTLSSSPGENIIDYVKDVYNMSNEEYVKHCMDAIVAGKRLVEVDPEYLFNIHNTYEYSKISFKEKVMALLINYISIFKYLLKKDSVTD